MIINNLIDPKTFSDLMKMYERQNIRVTNKVLNAKYVSYVVEGVQHLFTEDVSLFPIELVESFGDIKEDLIVENNLWKFNKTTGYWKLEKSIEKSEDAEKWLDIFQKDEPNAIFKLSNRKPKEDPNKTKINESVELIAKDFIKCHGKKPSGVGSWIFGIGSKKPEDWFEVKGKFSVAQKKAITKAEKDGKSKVFVMEDLSSEFQDVKYSVKKEQIGYRISLVVGGVETNVSNSITESAANNIGKRWVLKTLQERSLSKSEYKEREKVVKGMKSKISDFKKRYGDKAKSVMYGTATKIAKESLLYEYEEEESTFESDGRIFDLNKIFDASENLESRDWPIDELNWVLEYDKARLDELEPALERVDNADTSVPVLIWNSGVDGDEQWVVVDGVHRLAKAELQGDKTIPAKVLTDEIMDSAEIKEPGKVEEDYKADGVYYHGSPSGIFKGSSYGLHVGTKLAATQALESRIGVPAEGTWDGTREYGKTLIAGKNTLDRLEKERGYYLVTGFNAGPDVPEEDYYPKLGMATYSDGSNVSLDSKPKIFAIKINAPMSNTPNNPMSDSRANGQMKSQITKGSAKRGYFYKNIGEDEGSISAVIPPIPDSITIVNEDFKETSETGLRFPYKSIKFKDDSGTDVYRIVDALDQALAGTYTKQEADDIVKTFNAMSKIEKHALKESVKTFEIKYSIKDEDETIEGTKKYQAPDESTARTRFTEDNKDTPGVTINSIKEI